MLLNVGQMCTYVCSSVPLEHMKLCVSRVCLCQQYEGKINASHCFAEAPRHLLPTYSTRFRVFVYPVVDENTPGVCCCATTSDIFTVTGVPTGACALSVCAPRAPLSLKS